MLHMPSTHTIMLGCVEPAAQRQRHGHQTSEWRVLGVARGEHEGWPCTQAVSEEAIEALVAADPDVQLGGSEAGAGAASAAAAHGFKPLVHKLYKYKLEALLKELSTTLACCTLCTQLFSLAERARLLCPTAMAAAAASSAHAGDSTAGR